MLVYSFSTIKIYLCHILFLFSLFSSCLRDVYGKVNDCLVGLNNMTETLARL